MPMPGPESLQIMGYILLALALPVLAWAVLGDPSRGRLRCPKCWYRMEGIPKQETGWICPECGRKVAKERGLRRARRRWRWAVPALLAIMVASQMWQQPARANERLQTRWIPTTALVIFAPVNWNANTAPFNWAITSRLDSMPAAFRWVVHRRDWIGVRSALLSSPYTRDRWPLGVEPVIWLNDLEALSGHFERRSIAMKVMVEGSPVSESTFRLHTPWDEYFPRSPNDPIEGLKLPASARLGVHHAVVKLELSDGRFSRSVEVPLAFTVVPTIDEVISPLDLPEMAEEVRAKSQAHWFGPEGERSAWVSTHALGRRFVYRYRITSDDGQSIDLLGHFWMMRAGRDPPTDSPTLFALTSDLDAYLRAHTTLRVWEDPVLTLQGYPDATSYWSGAVEIPMSEASDRNWDSSRVVPIEGRTSIGAGPDGAATTNPSASEGLNSSRTNTERPP